jgi:hypothetical protein
MSGLSSCQAECWITAKRTEQYTQSAGFVFQKYGVLGELA